MIELRAMDEVFFTNGDVVRGSCSEDDDGKLKIKNYKTNTVRYFTMSEVKELKRKQTPEMAFEQFSKDAAGDAYKTLRLARECMRRFNNLNDKVVAMLEREAKSNNPDLLTFLCELYMQTGKTALALKVADQLVASASGRASSFMLRGLANLALGNTAAAEADMDKASKLAPDDPQVLVARANFLLNAGRSTEARNIFKDALAKNPRNVAALVGQGLVQMRQGEFQDAAKSFSEALAINDKHKQAKIGLANAKIMNKEFDEAYNIGESLLRNDPKCAEAYAMKAMAKLYAGDKPSIAAFERELKESLKEKPGQPRLVMAWAASLERQAKFEEALNTKESLAAARVFRDQAAAKYNELFAMDPADSCIQYFMGERKFKAGDYTGAQTAFQRTVQLAPSYAPAHASLGATSLNLSKWEAALDSYGKAIALDGTVGEYHGGTGLALLKMQRFEEAEAAFKRALELDPRNITARCGLGYVKNFSKNKIAAIDFFQQALAVDGNCAYAADALTKIYKQDDLHLEYTTFDNDAMPTGWKAKSAGSVKCSVAAGKLVFSGTQGSTAGARVEFHKDIKADDFARIEADFDVPVSSLVNFGLRIAAGIGGGINFECELGKDETGEIKVRKKDYSGVLSAWTPIGAKWPADGKIRLGMDTDDLRLGKVRLFVNGRQAAVQQLNLAKPGKITVGVFAQAPPKETVVGSVDNIVLVTKLAPGSSEEAPDLVIINDETKKPETPAPAPKDAPAPPKEAPK